MWNNKDHHCLLVAVVAVPFVLIMASIPCCALLSTSACNKKVFSDISMTSRKLSQIHHHHKRRSNPDDDNNTIDQSSGDISKQRRQFISRTLSIASSIGSSFIVLDGTNQASALDNELFKKNPLTNPLLEQIRIWEQAEADTVRYGGELERGDAGNKGQVDAYPRLLVPILQIASDINQINTLVQSGPSGYTDALQIISQNRYEKIQFKKTFNVYADNIYYSDPDRANLYLGGGTTPKSIQSLAYLLRNDILTNVEGIQAELKFLLANPDEPSDDLQKLASSANDAMNQYIEIIPPNELKKAKELMTNSV